MTPEELYTLVGNADRTELVKILDVKTLVLDTVREMPDEELLDILWKKLPGLSPDYVKDYLFMKRS